MRGEDFRDFVAMRGVVDPCSGCNGLGVEDPSGIICKQCWGSGDEHYHGVNLRELVKKIDALKYLVYEAYCEGFDASEFSWQSSNIRATLETLLD